MKIYRLSKTAQRKPQPFPLRGGGLFMCPEIRIGDTILVGRYRNHPTRIAQFGVDKDGQPTIISIEGITSKIFNFKIKRLMPFRKLEKPK